MSNLVVLNIELASIRSFLERVDKSIEAEYLSIIRREDAGEFEDEDAVENLTFGLVTSAEIAIRATLAELNALVEWELQQIAVAPLAQEQNSKGAKRKKVAWDLKRNELHQLIEGSYGITIEDLPGAAEIAAIHRTVNAYKHRKGFNDPRKDSDMTYFPEKFELATDEAFQRIETVKVFLQALWAATARKDGHQNRRAG